MYTLISMVVYKNRVTRKFTLQKNGFNKAIIQGMRNIFTFFLRRRVPTSPLIGDALPYSTYIYKKKIQAMMDIQRKQNGQKTFKFRPKTDTESINHNTIFVCTPVPESIHTHK